MMSVKYGSSGKGMAGHTGQSSQLFSVANARDAQFLATVARSTLVRQVDFDPWDCESEVRQKAKFLPLHKFVHKLVHTFWG